MAWEVNGADDIDTQTKPTPSVTPASTPKIEEKIPSYSSQGKWSDNVAETFDSGNGSKENPYVIKTASELALLAKNVNEGESYKDVYFELNNNIDLTEKYWTSIGNAEDKAFSGHFNGNGYEVKLNTENQKVSGLFGYTANAEITLLGVDGLVSGEDIGGGIVGIARDTKIENCYSNAAVVADKYVGGLVGQILSGSKVINCYATGIVKAQKQVHYSEHLQTVYRQKIYITELSAIKCRMAKTHQQIRILPQAKQTNICKATHLRMICGMLKNKKLTVKQ